jgi:hypothetical protein
MTNNETTLLHMLRAAIWQEPLEHYKPLPEINWKTVLNMAEENTVGALVASSIQRISETTLTNTIIDDETSDRCLAMQFSSIRINQQLNKVMDIVVKKISSNGITPILLKGQGIARLYPQPYLRTCGDIDLFIGEEHMTQTLKALEGIYQDTSLELDHPKHIEMVCFGIPLELHKTVINTTVEKNPFIHKWTIEQMHSSACRTVDIDGTEVTIGSELFDMVFQFYHMWRHYLKEGIGLRQVADWTVCINDTYDKVDYKELKQVLKQFKLLDKWQAFGCFIVRYMGLPRNRFPLYNSLQSYKSSIIAKEVIESGNFGRHSIKNFQENRPEERTKQRFYTMDFFTRKLFRQFVISPKAAMSHILFFYGSGISRLFRR